MEESDKKAPAKAPAQTKAAMDLAKEIKAMEAKKRADAMAQAPAAPVAAQHAGQQKMHFDAWYALRGGSIPSQHMKEILRADFKGRGLTDSETAARYDAALIKYGVKVK